MSDVTHFYVFYVSGQKLNFYDRTCGTRQAAEERVIELKKLHTDAIFFENDIPKDFKYFY